ncbi:hypothetical protein [Roseivirga spongicola]|uniref:hypothetical protein n=1 Tax=Roseivirga spongicola TaxID=333140 RepID=UPI002AC946A3|nr:hypothetical protein [Roseivirga spongicola]WPZ08777.1 hypothetical protein T7867_10960 [Roseivirga spongicola]
MAADDFYYLNKNVLFVGATDPYVPDTLGSIYDYTIKQYVEGGKYAEEKLILLDITDNSLYRVVSLSRPFTADNVSDDLSNGYIEAFAGGGTVSDNSITNAKLSDVSTATIKGRVSSGTGDPEDLSATQVRSLINVEDGSEANNISDANATDLTDGGDSSLHYHSSDRDRANHTGSQAISTVSGLQTALESKLVSSDIENFETTAELNTRDTNNRNRANHTGTQAQSTVTDLESDLSERVTKTLGTLTDGATVTVNGGSKDQATFDWTANTASVSLVFSAGTAAQVTSIFGKKTLAGDVTVTLDTTNYHFVDNDGADITSLVITNDNSTNKYFELSFLKSATFTDSSKPVIKVITSAI